MNKFPHRYDAEKKAVCVFFDFQEPQTLVPNDELKKWSECVRNKKTPCGKELSAAHFVFSNKKCAEYNEQALSFAQIIPCVGSLDKHEPLEGESTSFGVKEDFGIADDKNRIIEK